MDTPTRHFYPAPDYWPELEHKIAWVELIGGNERFGFVVGKVRGGEDLLALKTPVVPPIFRPWFTNADSNATWKMKTVWLYSYVET